MTSMVERDHDDVAFVGLGGMGAGMAQRLIQQGYPLLVFNRTSGKADPLVQRGARVADSLEQVGAARVVYLSLSDEHAVEQFLFDGLLAHLSPGATVIDTSTVSPAYSARLSAVWRVKG